MHYIAQFSLNSRLKIAIIRSAAISRASPSLEAFKTTGTALAPGNKADKVEKKRNIPLKLGFLSYDFNNHPTAHLIEAIFAKVVQCRGAQRLCDDVHIGMLNYGPNDQSEYRHRLENLADSVYDMPLQSHLQSAELIQRAGVDVLLDLQLHTLGNRAEIVAAHPAPIVVNYLVYPGTCGSTQHEYIVVDKTVVPPEVSIKPLCHIRVICNN